MISKNIADEADSIINNLKPEDMAPLTNEEIHIVVFSQKRNKAPGHGGTTLEHIQLFYTETAATIQRIIHGCMQFNCFPVQWKKAEVIILPKLK